MLAYFGSAVLAASILFLPIFHLDHRLNKKDRESK